MEYGVCLFFSVTVWEQPSTKSPAAGPSPLFSGKMPATSWERPPPPCSSSQVVVHLVGFLLCYRSDGTPQALAPAFLVGHVAAVEASIRSIDGFSS